MSNHPLILGNLDYSAERRIQECFQLLVKNTSDAMEKLKNGLKSDPSPIVRHEAAYSLGELSDDGGSVALIRAIEEDPNSFVVHEAALALSNLGVPEAETVLQHLLSHQDPNIVKTARISLQRLSMKQKNETIQDTGRTPEELITDLSVPEEHRIQAAFLLMEDGSTESVKTLLQALHQEPDPIVKHEIIFSLGETASSEVIPHLVDEMLTDSNIFVKHEAALALATLGNLQAKDAIEQLLDHEHPDVVESAEIALERLLS